MEGGKTTYYTRTNLMVAFIIGAVVGFGAYYLWDQRDAVRIIPSGGRNAAMEGEKGGDKKAQGGAQEETLSLAVSNQPAGLGVSLDRLEITKSVWIAIHEDNGQGEPGNILGAYRFGAGEYTDVTVPLLRNTEEGGTYYAMFHSDNGDETFDHEMDTPIRDVANRPLMEAFSTIRVR